MVIIILMREGWRQKKGEGEAGRQAMQKTGRQRARKIEREMDRERLYTHHHAGVTEGMQNGDKRIVKIENNALGLAEM